MYKGVTVKIVLDTRRSKKGSVYPLKLRVTYQRIQKYYNVGLFYSKEEYNSILKGVLDGKRNAKKIHSSWTEIENNAEKIIDKMSDFSFDRFRHLFFRPEGEHTNILYRLV